MNRRQNLTILTVAALSLSSQAGANGWEDLGKILSQACSAANGGATNVGGIPIPLGQTGDKLKFLCQLQQIHGFVNDNVLNGDWESFAKDIAGQYIGRLIGDVGNSIDTSALNTALTNINNSMKGTYADFRKALYGTAIQTLRNNGELLNKGAASDSVGGLTNQAILNNPTLRLADQIAAAADVYDAMQGTEKAYHAQKIQSEAKKAIEANLAQGMSNATSIIGTPVSEGTVDKYNSQAKTAISTREQVEILTNLTGEALKSKATSDIAILNQLSEMVQQQVMTNNQLMMQRNNADEEIATRRQKLNAEIEQEAADMKIQAAQASADVTGAYSAMSGFLDTKIELKSVGP
ncbi:hypothetical protein [Deinococcus fonticola]|uniref:hypothetical protein n=1 Tax=Deinococcus fonticola TaxID=2528713 RepID=UPI0010752443|nr:hypothetical protein [Deinococcus fonticola]